MVRRATVLGPCLLLGYVLSDRVGAAPALIRNGGFEEAAPGGAPTAWVVQATGQMASVGRATDDGNSGGACFDLGVLYRPKKGQCSSISQEMPLEAGKLYALSFAYLTGYKGRHPGYEQLFVSLNGGTVWICDLSTWAGDPLVPGSRFRQARLLFVAPSDRVSIAFGKRGLRDTGHGWDFHSLIDDVSVRPAKPGQEVTMVSSDKPHTVPAPPAHLLGDEALFETTMAHLSDEALLAALNLNRPELRDVRRASAQGPRPALEAFCSHLSTRIHPIDTVVRQDYRTELAAYRAAFPDKADSLARRFNNVHEWTIDDADRAVRGEHMYAGSASTWVAFEGGKVDWVTNHGNIYGFHYFGSFEPLFLAWLATDDPAYANAYADAFNDWWDQRDRVRPQRCVWYKLGLAIRGRRLARGLHHMAGTEAFDPETTTRLLKTLLGGCRWLVRDWESSPAWSSNWGLFVATGLIRVGALFPEFREADVWVALGEEIMKRYARTFRPDGGTEALGYHSGIMLSLFHPHKLLVANGLPGYLDDPRLRDGVTRGMRLLARATMPGGRFPGIGDGSYAYPTESLVLGAELLDDPELQSAVLTIGGTRIETEGGLHVPGRPPARTADQLRDAFPPQAPIESWQPGSYAFPDHGLTVLRRGDSPAERVYLAVSHGVYGHSHLDFLGITLFAHGKLLLGDRGVPCYYGPHTTDVRRSKAHSTLVVDGTDMARVKPELLLFDTSEAADLWRCRSTGYRHLGVVHTRTIVHLKTDGGCFVIADQVKRTTDAPRTLDVYFHSFAQSVTVESAQRVLLGDGPSLTITAPTDNGSLWQGKEWSVSHETNLVTLQLPFVAFRKAGETDEHFCAVLATSPDVRRRVDVSTTAAQSGALHIIVSEGESRHHVLVAGDDGTLTGLPDPPARWRPIAGEDGLVRLFREGTAP